MQDTNVLKILKRNSQDFSVNLENLPNPKNSNIVFEKQEEKILAAIRFDGWADDEKIEKYKSILRDELVKEKINFVNKFLFLGYNPPYEIMNRRNEVVVELINYQYSSITTSLY